MKKSKKDKNHNSETLWGFEPIQVTPVWPHKLFSVFQIKFPLFVNELYQLTNIVWSPESKSPNSYNKNKFSFIWMLLEFEKKSTMRELK